MDFPLRDGAICVSDGALDTCCRNACNLLTGLSASALFTVTVSDWPSSGDVAVFDNIPPVNTSTPGTITLNLSPAEAGVTGCLTLAATSGVPEYYCSVTAPSVSTNLGTFLKIVHVKLEHESNMLDFDTDAHGCAQASGADRPCLNAAATPIETIKLDCADVAIQVALMLNPDCCVCDFIWYGFNTFPPYTQLVQGSNADVQISVGSLNLYGLDCYSPPDDIDINGVPTPVDDTWIPGCIMGWIQGMSGSHLFDAQAQPPCHIPDPMQWTRVIPGAPYACNACAADGQTFSTLSLTCTGGNFELDWVGHYDPCYLSTPNCFTGCDLQLSAGIADSNCSLYCLDGNVMGTLTVRGTLLGQFTIANHEYCFTADIVILVTFRPGGA